MELEMIRKIREDLIEKYNENNFDINFFKTPSGITFHENFISLMEFTNFGILSVESIPILFSIFNSQRIKEVIQKVPADIIQKIINEVELSENETNEIKDLIQDDLKDKNLLEIINNLPKTNPFYDPKLRAKERLYSHFLISLYAYYDFYLTSIVKYIQGKLSDFDYADFSKNINVKDGPKEKLNSIKNYFKLIGKKDLDEIIKDTNWETNILQLKEVRDKLAHRDPDAKVIDITLEFKESYTKALSKVNKFYNQEILMENSILKNFLINFKPILELLILLMEIGKDCYAFLAIYDNLIDDYFKRRSP